LVDFKPLDSTINETALRESKETPGVHSARDSIIFTDGALMHDAARPDGAAATVNFLT